MRVMPPPFSVPTWRVTASRKTLALPIVVRPRVVTLLSRRQPLPILTWGPMTQNGPTWTSSAISALGSMTACGEILGISSEKKRKVNNERNQGARRPEPGVLGSLVGLDVSAGFISVTQAPHQPA